MMEHAAFPRDTTGDEPQSEFEAVHRVSPGTVRYLDDLIVSYFSLHRDTERATDMRTIIRVKNEWHLAIQHVRQRTRDRDVGPFSTSVINEIASRLNLDTRTVRSAMKRLHRSIATLRSRQVSRLSNRQ